LALKADTYCLELDISLVAIKAAKTTAVMIPMTANKPDGIGVIVSCFR
jgi:hypothetical protein